MKTVTNKRAKFDYVLIEKYEGGLVLLGTEVKSVKAGNISLKGSFVTFHGDEPYLINATIPPWQVKNSPVDYDPERSRKILLTKAETRELVGAKQTKGLTIVPVRVYTKGPRVKIEIALAKGKQMVDKKRETREKDIARETQRFLRGKD
ncbi:MAG: SsrA-binding protein [Candidatus Andersenbacteria bacterium RIFCSPHIGHO2_12_FULL_46_9]|nr:MAG: SsrA-binding protein [Parcubacteria group bacterium GW2011_GWA2_45_14]OGY35533.1 MAG: SsrA-binding protein [Candidatus Andersenbacteria bacterium RIFCSPHIGHO2_02_FULL_46_16]OGY37716.1 MAG: SsrA-binding protein [Candidatus Andersenbacteria bacterium RIFCSPHIGHO2_12_FULL_46_9]OGY37981.1 MAG: SsrA-binding protein [Candidatus Andersenbacteria bacterium RIFCSPLOWO2_02_FULL_46_11]OGY41507.1 MAG: SsrA-binding protein [Candidatus Andersenbacteria bacterium RIFCSPLOWO2_12_FULL_45_8]HBE90721.1 S